MMTTSDLAHKLREMYDTPGAGKVAMIHLFGIMYGAEMAASEVKPIDVIRAAQMSESYQTEISKGISLSKYVTVKPEYLKKF